MHNASPWWRQDAAFYGAVALIFALALGLRCWYMLHKTYVHVDESASITLSTYTAYGWDKDFEEGRIYSGDELRRLSYNVRPGVAALAEDLARLRMDNRDLPHTNLYYSLLRMAFWGVDSGDTHALLWRGMVLNLLFFGLGFVALYRLGRMVYGEDRGILLAALLVALVNPASLSSALLVRTYELQATLLAVMALVTAQYVQRMRDHLPCPGYGLFLTHGLAMTLCFLSGYFAIFYVLLLGMFLLYTAWAEKEGRYVPYLLCLTLLALIMAWSLFSPFLLGLFVDRGAEAAQKISLSYVAKNAGYLLDKFTYLYGQHVTGIGGALALLCGAWLSRGRWQKKARTRMGMGLLLICLIWSLLSFTLAPYKTLRYIMGAAPLVLLLSCVFLQYARWRRALLVLFLAGCLPLSFFPGNIEYFRLDPPLSYAPQPYVVSLSTPWRTGSFVPYIENRQEMIFYNSCESLRQNYARSPASTLLIDDEQFRRCHLQDLPNLHKIGESTYFSSYRVE